MGEVNRKNITRSPCFPLSAEADCHVTKQGEIWLDPNQFYGQQDDDDDVDENVDDEDVEIPQNVEQQPGRVACGVELEPDTPIRLVRRSAIHLVGANEGKFFKVYHCLFNSNDPRQCNEPEFLELPQKVISNIIST